MRRSSLCLGIVAAVVLAAVLLPGGRPPDSAMAQAGAEPGLAVSLRVARLVIQRGEPLATTLELANLGDQPITLALGCDPANDLHVYNGEGQRIWRLLPECEERASTMVLAAGEKRTWSATWPGTYGEGGSVRPGRYSLYGFVRTRPLSAVAGPVTIEVEGPDDPPREPTRVPTQRPPEPTATPVVSGETFPVTDEDGRQVRPDVAGDPELGECRNLVVWWDETSQAIFGRFVAPFWRGEPFRISGPAAAVGPAKVAMNPARRRWLVVWTGATEVGPTVIRGRYVDCDDLEGEPFHIGSSGEVPTVDDSEPAVADQGEGWVVVWRRAREGGGGHDILGGRVTGLATGAVIPLSDPAGGDVSEPAVDCEPRGGCLVAWTAGDLRGGDVVGVQWWSGEEEIALPRLAIADTDLREHYPSVAWNNTYDRGAYAVTWTEERRFAAVVARTVFRGEAPDPDLYQLGPSLEVRSTLGGAFHGDVAAVGPDFAVAWAEDPNLGAPDVAARRLRYSPESRNLSLEDVVIVSDAAETELYPAVSSARNPLALAVWQVERGVGGADIHGRHVVLPAGQVTLVGTVAGGTMVLQQGTLRVKVRRTLRGEFDCTEALVYVDPGTIPVMPRAGDMVSLRGTPATDGNACALQVGPAGTFLMRSVQLQAHLPFGMAR